MSAGGGRSRPVQRTPRIARALSMLRGKSVVMPGWKHDNLPV